MKILGIEGSPRKDGNTEKLVRRILAGAEEAGCRTDFVKLSELSINYCRGCGSCRANGECVMKDDMDQVMDGIQQSDVIILGSPIYVWQVSGTTKVFMDRLCRLLTPTYESRLNGKKTIAFAYTQGNPDAELFKPYFEYQEKVYNLLGFSVGERIQAVGTRGKEDILSQEATLTAAVDFGKGLANL